jgi:ribosomal protein S18 acetylase RimI-like enzyme
MLQLNKATHSDINRIADLAKLIWNQHYLSIIGQDQVNYMLDKIYNYESLLNQFSELNHLFFLISLNGKDIGFISISSRNEEDFFIHKFYVDQDCANTGIGTQILSQLEKKLSPKTISLTVNRQNFKSINFYFKNNFKIKSVEDFDIGNGYVMNDFVMYKTLS